MRENFRGVSYLLFMGLSLGLFNQSHGQIVEYSTSITVEGGKRVTERSMVIQVDDKDSKWLSTIQIPYRAGQKLDLGEAYIINSEGQNVRKLKKREIVTKSRISRGSFYEDSYIKEFKLHWNSYPYRIKYSYSITEKDFIYVSNWSPVVFTDVPTLYASLKVELPDDYKVSVEASDKLTYTSRQSEGKKIHQWIIRDFKTGNAELFSPPLLELIPRVIIVPNEFEYSIKGSTESWSSYGAWHQLLNKDSDILPRSEARKIDRLVAGIDNKKDIVKTLYHYMQDHTRYINVTLDEGGLKPYPASYVSENKYGDCKALTVYMKALLKHVDIPSYFTVIYGGSNPVKINKDLPGQQFNHVILSVPFDGDTLWLENTANYLPYNYLGSFTQGRHALLVDGEHSRLVKTPHLEIEDVSEKRKYAISLDKHGDGDANISMNVRGELFEDYKYYQQILSEEELQRKIENNLYLHDFRLRKWEIIHPDRDIPMLSVELELEVADQIREVSNLLVLQPVPLEIPRLENPQNRKTPVRINYPINKSDSLLYKLSFLDSPVSKLPENFELESRFGRYSERYESGSNQILVTREFKLYRGEYQEKEYLDFYNFIDSIRKNQRQSSIILYKSEP